MKSKLFLTVLLLAAIITGGCPRDKQSQDTKEKAAKAELDRISKLPTDVQSLAGVKGIRVDVGFFGEETQLRDLTKEQLKEDIESKFRLAEIKVNSQEEWSASEDRAFIGISIDTDSCDGSPNIAFSVSVEFAQRVKLLRRPHTTVTACSWQTGASGVFPKREVPEMVQQGVKDCVDRFINDYLTANPKK